ncbi:MAG: acetyltransferase [Cytophagaceae bacterium]
MLIYGASGHAKVVRDCLLAAGEQIKMVFDDNPSIKKFMGHDVDNVYSVDSFPQEKIILAIGDNLIRKTLSEKIRHVVGKAIHPSAILSPSSSVDAGSMVLHQAVINADAQIGKHVIVNTGSVVEHDCRLHDFVHLSPKATLNGGVTIGEGTHIGAGAIILPGVSIGKWCVIGAGSVVTKDVPDFCVMAGVPAKLLRKTVTNV